MLYGLVNAHHEALSFGREHTPRTIAVPEKEEPNRFCRQKQLDMHTGSLMRLRTTNPGDAHRSIGSWR